MGLSGVVSKLKLSPALKTLEGPALKTLESFSRTLPGVRTENLQPEALQLQPHT